MKTAIKLLAVFALLLTTFLQHSAASATEVEKFTFQGVGAVFASTQGCILTNVNVQAYEAVNQFPPENKITTRIVYLLIDQFDTCTNTQLLYAEGNAPVAKKDFRLAGNLDSATLKTTVTLVDSQFGATFDVFVNLTWTAVGPITRSGNNTNNQNHSPECKIHARYKDTYRPAEASGTVSDGTTNFTPEPSLAADFFTVKAGSQFIGCDF
jgi:hypothetical protein